MNCLDGISCCSVVASSTNAQKSGSMAHLTASARRRLKRNAMKKVQIQETEETVEDGAEESTPAPAPDHKAKRRK
eukprot:m.394268 g.394268  ORF g.394268 m.394268 type:complete len:75 (-) comp56371_c0_seq9:80-304(-)